MMRGRVEPFAMPIVVTLLEILGFATVACN